MRLSAGPEFDSNALRNPSVDQAVFPVVPDWDIRVLGLGGVTWRSTDGLHLVNCDAGLGGKVFIHQTGEDMIAATLDFDYTWFGAGKLMPGTGLWAKNISYMNGERSYFDGGTAGKLSYAVWRGGLVKFRAGVRGFAYPYDSDYSNIGPMAEGLLRQNLGAGFVLQTGVQYQYRFYSGDAYRYEPIDEQFIDKGYRRTDNVVIGFIGAEYSRRVFASLSYQLTYEASNSAGQSILRNHLAASFSARIPGDIYVHLAGTLQYSSFLDGIYISQFMYLGDDDENQNSFCVKISRQVWKGISMEFKYSLFLNEFATNNLSFNRQIFYIGAAWRL